MRLAYPKFSDPLLSTASHMIYLGVLAVEQNIIIVWNFERAGSIQSTTDGRELC